MARVLLLHIPYRLPRPLHIVVGLHLWTKSGLEVFSMEAKIKHLEFVQAAINRMAGNSFLLKGWSVTMTGALLAVGVKEADRHYLFISLAVLVLFWSLDGFYLSRERRFIGLYNHIRKTPEEGVDFSMDPRPYGRKCNWAVSAFSTTLLVFYGGLLAVQLILNCFL